jgi:hypothetical protein
VSFLVNLRQVGLFSQRSVRVHSHRRDLCDPRTDLLQHLLAGGKLLVVLI